MRHTFYQPGLGYVTVNKQKINKPSKKINLKNETNEKISLNNEISSNYNFENKSNIEERKKNMKKMKLIGKGVKFL